MSVNPWLHYPLVEEFLDEGFPEMFFDSFGLQHKAVMQLTQLLHEAVGACGRPVVLTAKVYRKTCRTGRTRNAVECVLGF